MVKEPKESKVKPEKFLSVCQTCYSGKISRHNKDISYYWPFRSHPQQACINPPGNIQALDLVPNAVRNLHSYQVLCLVLFQVLFQINGLFYHHQVYRLRFQWLRPEQHPADIQHNHHLTNILGSNFFKPSANPSKKISQSPCTIPTVLQSLKPSGTTSRFTTQQPSGFPNLPPSIIPSNKPSHIPSSIPSDNCSDSLSVFISVFPSPFPSITPNTLPSDIWSDKTSDNPIIHPLQVPTGLPSLVSFIQDIGFPTHVPSVYSSSRLMDGPNHLPNLHTRLNPSASLSKTPSGPPSA